jgi:hypothetical protein
MSEDKKETKKKYEKKDNIEQIQRSIQSMVHDIEKEKINLRISQERYSKKFREYNEILGKPAALTKEQRLLRIKEKIENLKKRDIFSPTYGKRVRPIKPEDEIKKIQKSASLQEIKLNDIKDSVNRQALMNEKIKDEIDEIRKDKVLLQTKLTKIEEVNEEIEQNLKELMEKNKERTKKLKYNVLKRTRNEGIFQEAKFKSDRDFLEDRYHKVIEATIRKERIRNNELSKQRLANAAIADNVRKKGSKVAKQEIREDNDEIQDRMPILDALLTKWNYIIKYKKNLINKYMLNSNQIRNSFNKLILLLGLESYDELPSIFEKNEIQMARIDEHLSKVTDDVDELKAKKELLEKQIFILSEAKKMANKNNEEYIKEKQANIEHLRQLNDNLMEEIDRKRQLFYELKECTFKFLTKMQDSYLVDFVVKRMIIEESSKINEQNVIDYLSSVYCFVQLIRDFEEFTQNKKQAEEDNMQNIQSVSVIMPVNKNIDDFQKEITNKYPKKIYDDCKDRIKKDIKQKCMFDDIIRRLANEIVDEVNIKVNQDNTALNTNAANQDNSKINNKNINTTLNNSTSKNNSPNRNNSASKSNLRYQESQI